jgi:hypothetical protein
VRVSFDRRPASVIFAASIFVFVVLFISYLKAHTNTDPEPIPDTRVNLTSFGLPKDFFSFNDVEPLTIIGYRFVVWLSPDEVVIGFNISPNSRVTPDRTVDGVARVLAFNLNGQLRAERDITYLADGYGELVAEGEAMEGPGATLLFRLQSVNLDPKGLTESPSAVLLLDANLKDISRIGRFLEQTTFVDHDLVFQDGFTLGQSRTYDIMSGSPPSQSRRRQQDWRMDAQDRKFGEHGLAYMTCQQELKPNQYVSTGVVYAGAKQRCKITVEDEKRDAWETSLKDGETAVIVGLLADGSVVAQISRPEKGNNAGELVLERKGKPAERLPWISREECGSVETATADMSRYSALTKDDECEDAGRWVVFDRVSPTPIVNRRLAKNACAALSPDGLHYATFESGELRIYSVPKLH